jgi:anti-anti-sigma regulatory factor
MDSRGFGIRSGPAGPFVTVLTLSGPVENGAHDQLRESLAEAGLASKRVVIDLTEATIYDSGPFSVIASETSRFTDAGGELVVVGGDNATVDPFVGDSSIPGLRWFTSLDDALIELLGEIVEQAGWPTELPAAR